MPYYARLTTLLIMLVAAPHIFAWSGQDTRDCRAAVAKNSPNAPNWYSAYYCNCVGREMNSEATIQNAMAICQAQMKNLMSMLAKNCADRLGRREEDKPQVRACLDKGPAR